MRFRRTGSERLKDGAKAFLRRVESIKSRRRKRQNRDGVIISGPQVSFFFSSSYFFLFNIKFVFFFIFKKKGFRFNTNEPKDDKFKMC